MALIPSDSYKAFVAKPGAFQDPLIGRMLDDFVIIEPLGKGGFARVYLALEWPLLMKAAIKVAAPMTRNEDVFDSEELRDRLEVEAMALSRIHHPNVVSLLSYSDSGDLPYLAMEWVGPATSLYDEIEDLHDWKQRMSRDKAMHIIKQLMDGLQAAHEEQVLHLDLSPSNIMLQRVVGNRHLVRLHDFGLAHLMDEADEDLQGLGTPRYIAPEQLDGGELSAATDTYSLGMIVFTLLNWRSPFHGQKKEQILANKRRTDYKPDSVLAADTLTGAETRFYRKAMAHSPGDRFTTVEAFRSGLFQL